MGGRKIDWEEIYTNMRNEKYGGKGITGNQYIRNIKEINANNRTLFWEYHKYCISRLPKYDDVYSVYFTNIKREQLDKFREIYKDWEIEINDTPRRRHNFNKLSDYNNYIDKYVEGKLNSLLFSYKLKRKDIVGFLLDSEINNKNLHDMNQKDINSYISRIIDNVDSFRIESHISSLGDFLLFINNVLERDLYIEKYKSIISVPIWEVKPPTKELATDTQINFYNYWLSKFENNIAIDVNGVLQYLFLYLYDVVADFIKTRDISKFNREFEKIDKNYGHYETIRRYLYFWWQDAYLLIGDDKKYLEYKLKDYARFSRSKKDSIIINKTIDEIYEVDDISLIDEAFFLVMKNKKHFTEIGLNNMEDIIEVTKKYLESFKLENGANLKDYFYNKFEFWDLSEEDFMELKECIVANDFKIYENKTYKAKIERFQILKENHIKQSKEKNKEIRILNNLIKYPQKYAKLKKSDFNNNCDYEKYLLDQSNCAKDKLFNINYGKINLFKYLPESYNVEECYVTHKNIPQIIAEAYEGKKGIIIREIENIFRDKRGIPKVGEGWISETTLYKQIKEAFPDEKIIHHGRPAWLHRQHLDIFFPEKNIGVEYQGLQHDEAIEFFGGAEAFKKGQIRDMNKKKLCENNNCELILVYPNYNFEEIKIQIEELLSANT